MIAISILTILAVSTPARQEVQFRRPETQQELINSVSAGTLAEKSSAVYRAIQIAKADRSPELCKALLKEFRSEAAHRLARRAGTAPPAEGEGRGEYLGDLVQSMAGCPDSAAIPALVSLAETGSMAQGILAEHGEAAVEPVLEALRSAENPIREFALVEVLRLTVVQPVRTPVADGTKTTIASVAQTGLAAAKDPMVIGAYASLAVAIDPATKATVDAAISPASLNGRGLKPEQQAVVERVVSTADKRMPRRKDAARP